MYGKVKTHNFFVTTLDGTINDTDTSGTIYITDKTVNGVTLLDGSYIFWLLVGLNNPTEMEIFRITNVSNKTLTYDRRISPNGMNTHISGDLVNLNDMSEYINYLSANVNDFGYTETVTGTGNELKVKVYGGNVIRVSAIDTSVSDTTLTLPNNSTVYIYYDDINNTFNYSTTNLSSYYIVAMVVTLGGIITTLTDYRAISFGLGCIPQAYTVAELAALTGVRNGTIVFNSTSGTLNRYEGGEWIDFSFGGTANPRLSEVVEGKARYATTAEFNANLDTGLDGASLVPKVSQVVGGGDVYGPGTHLDGYIPQWDGIDSNTLKAGLIVPAGGLAGITALNTKQETLVSTSNIKSLSGKTILGSGDLPLPGFVTVGTGKDYTTFDAAISAGQKNLHCYGTLSTSTRIPEGSTIYLASGCVLTYSYSNYTYGVHISGQGTLNTVIVNYRDSMIRDITINVSGSGNLYMTGTGFSLFNCHVTVTGYSTLQIEGNRFRNNITGNEFNLNSTGRNHIASMSGNKFNINGTTEYVSISDITNSYIYIDGSSAANDLHIEGFCIGNYIEVEWSASYILRIPSGDCRIIGNHILGQGAYSSQTCTIIGTGEYDRFIFNDNIITATVELNTLDRGVYTGNLIYAQAANVSVTNVTSANNQTGY